LKESARDDAARAWTRMMTRAKLWLRSRSEEAVSLRHDD
jgi:hypothetical protein